MVIFGDPMDYDFSGFHVGMLIVKRGESGSSDVEGDDDDDDGFLPAFSLPFLVSSLGLGMIAVEMRRRRP